MVLSPTTRIDHPSSDGLPMAESDSQRKPLIYAIQALTVYFQERPDVYVLGNLFIYYEEGNPQAVVVPDVFVILGVAPYDRPSYMLWREPKAPDFIMEITSRSTRSDDQGAKRGIYAFLGVQEYWQYDPIGDYLMPPLQGLRLEGRNYQPLTATTLEELSSSPGLPARSWSGVQVPAGSATPERHRAWPGPPAQSPRRPYWRAHRG
jgi:Uma2 family endonuclease